jgi:hypothetical protein
MQALLWMLYVAPADGRAVVVLCDSHYAMGVAEGLIDAKSNLEAACLCRNCCNGCGGNGASRSVT